MRIDWSSFLNSLIGLKNPFDEISTPMAGILKKSSLL